MIYLAIMLAGGSGALLRYSVGRFALSMQWTALPFGTLIVNVLGSFLMGYLSWTLAQKWQMSKELQVAVLTGLLGGFTTFSAFSLEMVSMLEQGLTARAVVYMISSVLLCVAMCALGLYLARN